ncbi:MAG TPA: 1,4-dihydroxy-2-naphthoate polyprenyltransferase [Opitutaceae bacterium]|nr:1,4-dihydroxy-2-naphthoate polyprenyltransferase [Opitutaceae bacterium]
MNPWLLASRPKTLPAALVPVLVGSALAAREGFYNWQAAALCLGFALLVQIGTNFANDYFDFRRGADSPSRVGPRRAVASGLVSPGAMRAAAALMFAAAFVVGLGLVRFGGWWLVPLGMVCIACGLAYTGGPYPLAYNGLGDLFVFIFFGLVAVSTTYFVQAGAPGVDVWLTGAAIGLLSTNLLVANNYRDRDGDAAVGKRTLVVILGECAARIQYVGSNAAAFAGVVALWLRSGSPWLLLPLVTLPLAVWNIVSLRPSATPPKLIRLLGRTAALLLAYGVLLSVGLALAQRR